MDGGYIFQKEEKWHLKRAIEYPIIQAIVCSSDYGL